jgi:hypothetical protein
MAPAADMLGELLPAARRKARHRFGRIGPERTQAVPSPCLARIFLLGAVLRIFLKFVF